MPRRSEVPNEYSLHFRLSFAEFATNEAIECTEIYEYAQSLSNPGYTLPTLGLYKYLHAKRFIDQGFVQEGLNYCERLALDIVRLVRLLSTSDDELHAVMSSLFLF